MPQHHDRLDGLTVLHLAQPVEGGVARVVTDLVRAQVRAGARVVVACPPDGPLGPDAEAAGAETVPWAARRGPGPWLAGEVAAAARVVRGARPDLVHLHSAKAGLAGRLAVRGRVPTVFQPHAWSFEAVRGPLRAAAVLWERLAAARWTHLLLCVSEAERRGGRDNGLRAAWAVVPNGTDTARFAPPGDRAPGRVVAPRGPGGSGGPGGPGGQDPVGPGGAGGPGGPVVVCVGRLCAQKGQDVLLRAWRPVAERWPGARLVLVGDGPDRERLLRDAPDGVVFAGTAGDTLPYYQAADVVVLPSRWEGMAVAPLEAMACGRPVVLTDVGGSRECLPPDDAGTCLVPPDDVGALSAALTRLLADPDLRAATGARALAHVRARHDLRRTVAAVTALYAGLLGLRTSAANAPATNASAASAPAPHALADGLPR